MAIVKIKIDAGIQTREQLCTKIAQLDTLIVKLYDTALLLAGDANYAEYEIDTGQSKQKVKYRSAEEVGASIERYEKLRQQLQNKLTSPGFRLMDSKNFR